MKQGRGDGNRRGAVLVVVFVTVLVLSILAGAILVLFRANVKSQLASHRQIQARYAAESGVQLAMHYMALESYQAGETEPFFLPGDSLGWIDLFGEGEMALVVVDPMDGGFGERYNRSVEIRSRGRFADSEVDVIVKASPDTPSRYVLVTDGGISNGYLSDGLELGGPVHSNGVIEFSSLTPDSTDDPVIPEVSTTGGGGFYFMDAGFSDDPHPDGSRIWVRPYRRHQSGTPSWNNIAAPLDFQRINDHFEDMRTEATAMGTYVSGVRRVLLAGDRVLMKRSENSFVDTLVLGGGRDLIYLDNPGAGVLIRSRHTLSVPLTIVSTGPVKISGHIDACTSDNGGPLAIVSLDDITVAQDPGLADWLPPWDIATDGNVTVKAFLAAPSGEFGAENIFSPDFPAQLTVLGGILAGEFGLTGTESTGYRLSLVYDAGLTYMRPPHFPIFEFWKLQSWESGHHIAGDDISENRF